MNAAVEFVSAAVPSWPIKAALDVWAASQSGKLQLTENLKVNVSIRNSSIATDNDTNRLNEFKNELNIEISKWEILSFSGSRSLIEMKCEFAEKFLKI